MYKRYDLIVCHSGNEIYRASFSSLNHLVRFAAGFDSYSCEIEAINTLFEKPIPIYELIDEFKGDYCGI